MTRSPAPGEVTAVSVHGPHGVVDLTVPTAATCAEVAQAYAAQARLGRVLPLVTGSGLALAPGTTLDQAGVRPGAVLVAVDPEAHPEAGGRRTPVAEEAALRPGALSAHAALARRPALAAVAAATGAAAMARTLRAADIPTSGLLPATVRAVQQTYLGVGRYASQFALPLLVASLFKRQLRYAVTALLAGPPVSAWLASQRRLDFVRFAVGMIADEAAYGAGVWTGCVRARTGAPLRPAVVWRPLRIDARRS